MNTVKGIFSHKSDEWETPLALFNEYNVRYHFTLDPCCTHDNAKCIKHFTKDENGLEQDWTGETVWCNPPYSNVYEWCKKALNEAIEHGVTTVMLLPSRTDTRWFHEIVLEWATVRFLRGRLRFGNSTQNAPFASIIVLFSGKLSVWKRGDKQ